MKLNQIIAIEKGVKAEGQRKLSDLYKQAQKAAPFEGINRTYSPLNDDPSTPAGERLPSENKRVEYRAQDLVDQVSALMTERVDILLTKDVANCTAVADVVVDGVVVAKKLPVTTLLSLEKELTDIHTFVKSLPVLGSGDSWTYDAGQDLFASVPVETARTKKVNKPLTLAPATDKHPAQVQMVTEDVPAGIWRTVKYSGALEARRVNEFVSRVEKLQRAVKFAREEANGAECTMQHVGDRIFTYLFK